MPEFTAIVPTPFPFSRAMRSADAAVFLQVGESRINHLVESGTLRAHKVRGATWIDVDSIMEYRVRQIARQK